MKSSRDYLSSLFEWSCIALFVWAFYFAGPSIQKVASLILAICYIVHIVRKVDKRFTALETKVEKLSEYLNQHKR